MSHKLTSDLVLEALELGMMVHGGGKPATGRSESGVFYKNPVYSVMVSATTKTKIVVYAAATHEVHEIALREALANAIERAKSKVQRLKP